jgi:rhodanese-related sulfurtransferase
MESLLLAVHVVAGILFVGPVAVAASLFPRYVPVKAGGAPSDSHDGTARLLHRITRGYGAVAIVVPVLGLVLALVQGRLGGTWDRVRGRHPGRVHRPDAGAGAELARRLRPEGTRHGDRPFQRAVGDRRGAHGGTPRGGGRVSLRHYFRRPPAVSAEQAVRLVAEGALVVDVRRRFEWNRVHIPGAVHAPLEELLDRCAEFPDDRLIITFCTGGLRSAGAANLLVENGFEAVNMSGGLVHWRAAGGPLSN